MLGCLAGPAGAQPLTSDQLANRVKAEFLHAWQGYKDHAWGHDAYRPLSQTAEDWYGTPFFITALEALDALSLMRLDKEADSTREFLATHLSFDRDVFVPTCEFASRVLGALIASYQLSADQRLLTLADNLGTRLLPAFVTATGMPYHEVNLKTGAVRGEVCSPAEIGSAFIDFAALAMITQKPAYYNHSKIALLELYNRRSSLDLVGEAINIDTGEWTKTESHLGSGIGAYYMAILKSVYLFNESDCAQMWNTHYAAINRHLLDSTATGYWYCRVDMNSGKRTGTLCSTHDALISGAQGMFRDLDRAERSIQSYFGLWTKEGIEPELYDYAAGSIKDARYALDPEITESVYILYRTTGNPVYLHMAKAFLDSLITYCRTDEGYAGLSSVATKQKEDRLDPHFFGGTMKYLYLIFSSPDVLDFEKVIMNSQGHPIRKAW